MIELSRISKIPTAKVEGKTPELSQKTGIEKNTNLKLMPQYPALSWINVKCSAQKAMSDFKKEFGEVKSATYIAEKAKQLKRTGASEEVLDKLFDMRRQYSAKIKEMRNNIYSVKYESYEDYINALKKHIKENGSYMNCNECADLMLEKLRRRGIEATNVCIYSVNEKGEKTCVTEHVFTVAGLSKNADIKNPQTWGSNAIICDAWAGICDKAENGIKFYKEFFAPEKGRNCFKFEYNNRNYGIEE